MKYIILMMCAIAQAICATLQAEQDPKTILESAIEHRSTLESYIYTKKLGTLSSGNSVISRFYISKTREGKLRKRTETYTLVNGHEQNVRVRIDTGSATWDIESDILIKVPDSMSEISDSNYDLISKIGKLRNEHPSQFTFLILPKLGNKNMYLVREVLSMEARGCIKELIEKQRLGAIKNASFRLKEDHADSCPAKFEYIIDGEINIVVAERITAEDGHLLSYDGLESILICPVSEDMFALPTGRAPIFPSTEEEYFALRLKYSKSDVGKQDKTK